MDGTERGKGRHLSLLEVAVVLIVIAALSLFAIPVVQSRRILVNEERARTMLREIHAAEREFFAGNDQRTYGFLGELLGRDDRRSGVRTRPRMLAASGLEPVGSAYLKDGYLYVIALPGRGVAGVTSDDYANADFEKLDEGYLAYAWPINAGYSGRLVYVIDQTGDLRQYRNDLDPPFSGPGAPPPLNLGSRKGDAFGGPPPIARELKFEPVPE